MAHLVGDDQGEAVTALRRDEREAEAGVAGGRLDEVALVRAEEAVALGGRDHRQPDAILDRASRVLALELEEELAGARVEALQPEERRVADEREDAAFVALHDEGRFSS
jgi:hypothetical protein